MAHQVPLCLCRSCQRLGIQDTCGGISPWCCPVSRETSPSGRGIPSPCQGTPTLPLLALPHFFGRQGDKVFLFLPAASSFCSCLEAAPLALKGSAGISPEE